MSNKVIVELNYYRPVYVNGRQIPDYHAMIQRRLHGLTVKYSDTQPAFYLHHK